jgi:hypothetical protein
LREFDFGVEHVDDQDSRGDRECAALFKDAFPDTKKKPNKHKRLVSRVYGSEEQKEESEIPFGGGDLVSDTRHSHAEKVIDTGLVVGGGIDDED